MSQSPIMTALELLKAGDLRAGPQMDSAHQICQEHEGTQLFDWTHALVHRIEGDDGNAAYWYRQAGKIRHAGSAQEEWDIIAAAAKAS